MPGNSPPKNTSRVAGNPPFSSSLLVISSCGSSGAFRVLWGGREPDDVTLQGCSASLRNGCQDVKHMQGVSAVLPVVGGFLADSYIGRFRTILLASTIYLIGLVLLTVAVSAVPPPGQGTVFFIALYVLAVGEGGHKPCVQTFAADQFDEGLPEEKAAKSSFFNWWYVGIVCGATAAVLVVIYVEDYVGWKFGFGMLVVAVAAALVVFLIGSGSYRRQAPVGSPFTRVAQVMVAAVRKRRLAEEEGRGICVEEDGGTVHPLSRTSQFSQINPLCLLSFT
ncbi:protein NRT1/ PTR FAMILY 5.4 [Sesamum angolense]|uniref:Protein NRT1/ PTR FAMILY 5.4 n=1 Tax=Sesamum angolense TaxID=2727404 RepID=A0AAE2C2J5_9LAMI|nr:protein NRT1/ PTR FAMILY 5.4 [Sesamum angolense]